MISVSLFSSLKERAPAGQAGARGVLAGLALAALFLGAGPAMAQDAASGYNPVPVGPGAAKVINVSITGSTPELTALMRRAFQLHGEFHVAGAGEAAEYALRFDANGAGVTVSADPKSVGGTPLHQSFTGADWRNAAYQAGDYVVQKLTGAPGFFAGRLAFVSRRSGSREIYDSDLLGQQISQLTNDHSDSLNPHWSPDGAKILYTGYYRTGFMEIFLIDLAGRQRRPFADYKGMNTGGAYSPDGSHVAMILSSGDHLELYVSDAQGHSIRRLTETTSVKASPTWSPDGSMIALSGDPRGYPLLYEIPAAGGTMTSIPTYISNNCYEASWNPRDPNLLVFTAARGNGLQIALYNFQTREAKWLPTPGDSLEPCWANDGRHIIYTSRQSNQQQQLAILDTVTGHNAYLTTKDAFQPAFVYPK